MRAPLLSCTVRLWKSFKELFLFAHRNVFVIGKRVQRYGKIIHQTKFFENFF
jgi:hypothetical protein